METITGISKEEFMSSDFSIPVPAMLHLAGEIYHSVQDEFDKRNIQHCHRKRIIELVATLLDRSNFCGASPSSSGAERFALQIRSEVDSVVPEQPQQQSDRRSGL